MSGTHASVLLTEKPGHHFRRSRLGELSLLKRRKTNPNEPGSGSRGFTSSVRVDKSLQCVFRLTNLMITSLIFLLPLGLKSGSKEMFWVFGFFFFDLTAVFKNQTRLKTSQLSLSRRGVTVSNCDLAISCCALVLNYC